VDSGLRDPKGDQDVPYGLDASGGGIGGTASSLMEGVPRDIYCSGRKRRNHTPKRDKSILPESPSKEIDCVTPLTKEHSDDKGMHEIN
jgi:hypothetical protein